MATTRQRVYADTFNVLIPTPGFQPLRSYPVPMWSAMRLILEVLSRATDGTSHAIFKRTGLFYRDGGPVSIDRTWLSDQTDKSDKSIDVSFSLNTADVTLLAKNAGVVATRWVGQVSILPVSS